MSYDYELKMCDGRLRPQDEKGTFLFDWPGIDLLSNTIFQEGNHFINFLPNST